MAAHIHPRMIQLLRRPALEAAIGMPRSTIYDAIDKGLLVPPVAIGERSVAWPSNEVEAIISARIAGQNDDEIRALVRRLLQDRKAA